MQFEYRSKLFDIVGVSQSDLIARRIARSGNFYEIDLLEYVFCLRSYFRSKNNMNVVVDVGANIGNHSIFFGSFIADHLIAIEPNPDLIAVLRRNLSRNIDNYTLREFALGEKEGRGSIELPDDAGDNIGAAKVDPTNKDGIIEISTLDSALNSWKQSVGKSISVCLIKIDVEGMEQQVLKGAEKTILEYKPDIVAEAATKEQLEVILSYLQRLGYRKLPGHLAETPVYHFAYKPAFSLIMTCVYMRLKRVVRKMKLRLTRRFAGG